MSDAAGKPLRIASETIPPHSAEGRSSESHPAEGPSAKGADWLPQWLLGEIQARTDALMPDVVQLRRHLHRNPELSEREFETTRHLAASVESLGLKAVVCESGTGLTCDLLAGPASMLPSSGPAPKRLMIRGDIDALPIEDGKTVEYRSRQRGAMHACGHDAHPAIIYGTLRLLTSLQRDDLLPWPVAVRGLFQPAEEVATGAAAMIHAHALRDVGAALALHVDPTRAVGRIGLRHGTLTASCDTFRVDFVGSGGHGARPHLAHDPIEAAAAWIIAAYRRVPRAISAHETVVLSVGQIQAGHASNIIPDTAVLQGTLRSLSAASRRQALEVLGEINESIHRESHVEVSIHIDRSAPAVVNDGGMVDLLALAAGESLGDEAIDWIGAPSMGSEDFSYYLHHVPGAMFRLGVAGDQVGHAPLHTHQFDIDERAMAVGIRLFAGAAIRYFKTI